MTVRLGRRGTILALLGVAWILQGISTFFNEPSPSYPLLNEYPIIRGSAWILTGLVSIWYAKKPQGHDIAGFVSLYLMAAYRIIAYGVSFVLWLLPGGFEGNPRGIVGIFSWATIIILLIAVSGWSENDQEVRE